MSFMVPNGFRVDGTDMVAMQRLVSSFRRDLAPMAAETHASLISEIACRFIDEAYAGDRDWQPAPFNAACDHVDRERRELATGPHRKPRYDFGMTLYLLPDARTRCTYGTMASERSDWTQLWLSRPRVQPYGYWDNTDRDEDVPAADWRRRRDIWKRLLPSGSLRDQCMIVEMNHDHMVSTMDDVVRLQPTRRARTGSIARERIVSTMLDDMPKGDIVRNVMKVMDELDTEDGMEKVRAAEITIRIPERIDETMLMADAMPQHTNRGR